jgi:hypothetical protein
MLPCAAPLDPRVKKLRADVSKLSDRTADPKSTLQGHVAAIVALKASAFAASPLNIASLEAAVATYKAFDARVAHLLRVANDQTELTAHLKAEQR